MYMKTYTFSPSSLSLLKECPRLFWLHFNKGIRLPATPFPSLPSGMDRIIKQHFDKHQHTNTLPPEIQQLKQTQLFDDTNKLEEWQNPRKGLRYTDEKGNTVMGAVDYVLTQNNKLVIIDFKTRGTAPHENTAQYSSDQLTIYTWLLQQNGYQTQNYAYLLFYHPSHINNNGDIIFHKEIIRVDINTADAKKIFDSALQILRGPMPPANQNNEFNRWFAQASKEISQTGLDRF